MPANAYYKAIVFFTNYNIIVRRHIIYRYKSSKEANRRVFVAMILSAVYTLLWMWAVLALFFVVKADSFYPSGDILRCEFVPAVGLALDRLPTNTPGFSYDVNSVVGVAQTVALNNTLLDLADVRVGHVNRKAVMHSIVAPPHTKIGFYLYAFNFAGHNVRVDKVYIPAKGKTTLGFSDLLNISQSKLVIGNVNILYSGHYLKRSGQFISFAPYKIFGQDSFHHSQKGIELGAFELKQPVQVSKVESQCYLKQNGYFARQTYICLKNAVNFATNGTLHSQEYNKNAKLQAGGSKCFEIKENIADQYVEFLPEGHYSYFDSGGYQACNAYTDVRGDSYDMKSRSVFVLRNDSVGGNWHAWQPGFAHVLPNHQNFMCIKMSPYVLKGTIKSCQFKKQVKIQIQSPVSVKAGQTFNLHVSIQNLGRGIHFEKIHINLINFWKNRLVFVFNGQEHVGTNGIDISVRDFKPLEKRSFTIVVKFHKPVDYFSSQDNNVHFTADFAGTRATTDTKIFAEWGIKANINTFCLGNVSMAKINWASYGDDLNLHNSVVRFDERVPGKSSWQCAGRLSGDNNGTVTVGFMPGQRYLFTACVGWGSENKCRSFYVQRFCNFIAYVPPVINFRFNVPKQNQKIAQVGVPIKFGKFVGKPRDLFVSRQDMKRARALMKAKGIVADSYSLFKYGQNAKRAGMSIRLGEFVAKPYGLFRFNVNSATNCEDNKRLRATCFNLNTILSTSVWDVQHAHDAPGAREIYIWGGWGRAYALLWGNWLKTLKNKTSLQTLTTMGFYLITIGSLGMLIGLILALVLFIIHII